MADLSLVNPPNHQYMTTKSEVQQAKLLRIITEKGGILVSGTYQHSKRSRFVIRCAEGHEWESNFNNLTSPTASWCPHSSHLQRTKKMIE